MLSHLQNSGPKPESSIDAKDVAVSPIQILGANICFYDGFAVGFIPVEAAHDASYTVLPCH